MYKEDKIIVILLMVIFFAISIIFKIEITKENINGFLTFFTVYLGFMSTTFAILADNKEIKKLYHKYDSDDGRIRLLHRLGNYFKISFNLIIFSIILLLISPLFNLEFIVSNLILSLLFSTLYSSKIILKILFDVFLNKIVV